MRLIGRQDNQIMTVYPLRFRVLQSMIWDGCWQNCICKHWLGNLLWNLIIIWPEDIPRKVWSIGVIVKVMRCNLNNFYTVDTDDDFWSEDKECEMLQRFLKSDSFRDGLCTSWGECLLSQWTMARKSSILNMTSSSNISYLYDELIQEGKSQVKTNPTLKDNSRKDLWLWKKTNDRLEVSALSLTSVLSCESYCFFMKLMLVNKVQFECFIITYIPKNLG